MMHNSVYFMAGVAALSGLWMLWDLALRGLFLDMLRERVFELRFRLFEMAASDAVSFDCDAYRSFEILLNGVLRYAHRFTLLTYFLSAREQTRAKKEKDYEDISQQLALKIARVDPASQAKLLKILSDLQHALIAFMAATSLLFLFIAVVLFVLKFLNVVTVVSKKQITAVFEQEVYTAESQQPRLVAV